MLGYIIAVSQLGLCGVYILICQNVIKQSSEGVMILLVGIMMMKCCVSYNATDRQGQKKSWHSLLSKPTPTQTISHYSS